MIARSRASHARAVSGVVAAGSQPVLSCAAAGAAVAVAVRAGVAAAGVVAEPVELDAQPDQILQGAGVHVAGHERDHRGVARDGLGGVAVQPGPAATPAAGGGAGAVPGPLRPDPGRPLLQQRRAAVQDHQVGQGDVHHGLDRLPGPLRQQARGDQPPHRFLQGVMAALRLAPGILRPGRGRQRVQHRGQNGGALRGEIPGQDPGALERGLQLHRPVAERLVLVLVFVLGEGPGVDLPGQPGQVRHIRAARRRPEQDRVRVLLAVRRELVGPAADGPRDRLRDRPRRPAPARSRGGRRRAGPRRCTRPRRPW